MLFRRPCEARSWVVLEIAIFLGAAPIFAQVATKPALSRTAEDRVVARMQQAYREAGGRRSLSRLPVGVFDSGTGGLTVLEQLLTIDQFDNRTHAPASRGDGRPDFELERFQFLADQANMPYGQYPVVGKRDFLIDLAVRDAEFLAGRCYHPSATAEQALSGKLPVKIVVIACNTATAYGKVRIEEVIGRAKIGVKVIGVIDAGAEGALDALGGAGATVGVLATQGTVLSGAYPAAIQRLALQRGIRGGIAVVQQGSLGLAGAIDGAPEFITAKAADGRPRAEYRGPSFTSAEAPIEGRLLPRLAFDFSNHAMLFDGDPASPSNLQINSVRNYVAYDTTMLLESVRAANRRQPLGVVILGCTHFPFVTDVFREELKRLYDYQENGQYVYRPFMAEKIALIDPAFHTAREVYASLAAAGQLAGPTARGDGRPRGEFYITVPYRLHPAVRLDPSGWFTFQYKYGRTGALELTDVRTIPMTPPVLGPEVAARLRGRVPKTWRLLEEASWNVSPASYSSSAVKSGS
jgi:glutamate racemase